VRCKKSPIADARNGVEYSERSIYHELSVIFPGSFAPVRHPLAGSSRSARITSRIGRSLHALAIDEAKDAVFGYFTLVAARLGLISAIRRSAWRTSGIDGAPGSA
jgi:hypothetical protein